MFPEHEMLLQFLDQWQLMETAEHEEVELFLEASTDIRSSQG